MQAAQLVHAAGESSLGNLPAGTYAIALHAKNAEHLETISGVLTAQGVEHKRIVEDDGPLSGQLVAIGVKPGPRSILRRYFSSLPLVK